VIFVFDSDDAGVRAAFKASLLALELDFEVKIAHLPEGKDPADIIVDNRDQYKQVIKQSQGVFEYWVHYLVHTGMPQRERNKALEETIFPLLAHHGNALEQDRYVQYVASQLHLSADAIRSQLSKHKQSRYTTDVQTSHTHHAEAVSDQKQGHTPIERLALIVYWQNSLSKEHQLVDVQTAVYDKIDEETQMYLETALAKCTDALNIERDLFSLENLYETSIILENDIKELLEHLSTYRFKEHQQTLMNNYRQAKARGDEEDAMQYLQQLQKTLTQYGHKTTQQNKQAN
jgi:DNA primase